MPANRFDIMLQDQIIAIAFTAIYPSIPDTRIVIVVTLDRKGHITSQNGKKIELAHYCDLYQSRSDMEAIKDLLSNKTSIEPHKVSIKES